MVSHPDGLLGLLSQKYQGLLVDDELASDDELVLLLLMLPELEPPGAVALPWLLLSVIDPFVTVLTLLPVLVPVAV